MAEHIILNPNNLTELRKVNPQLISYNVEMTEVTGGTFWKAYTALKSKIIKRIQDSLKGM